MKRAEEFIEGKIYKSNVQLCADRLSYARNKAEAIELYIKCTESKTRNQIEEFSYECFSGVVLMSSRPNNHPIGEHSDTWYIPYGWEEVEIEELKDKSQ